MRKQIMIGLTSAVAAAAIAAPAQAQVAPPAAAAGAANGATVQIGTCTVKHSRHGYAWASCPIIANNVAYNQSFDIQFKSNLKTFKPATNATWSNQSGELGFSGNGGLPGQGTGTATQVTSGLKLAFKGKSVAQVGRSLKVTISATAPGVTVTQAVGTAVQGS